MKFLIVVALFAVFKADCRHFSDEPTNQVEASNIGPLPFTDEPVNVDGTDGVHYTAFEPESPNLTELPKYHYNMEPAPPIVDENEENENALRGKGGKNNLKKLVKELESKIKNITDTNTNTKLELKSQMKNITDSNTGLQTDINSIKSNMSSIVSKLNSIEAKLDCPGCLSVGPDNFVSYHNMSAMSWADARAVCQRVGLDLYEPLDPVAVSQFLEDSFNNGGNLLYWLGGRGNGTSQIWLSGRTVPTNGPWVTRFASWVATNHCMFLYARNGLASKKTVLGAYSCTYTSEMKPLCG